MLSFRASARNPSLSLCFCLNLRSPIFHYAAGLCPTRPRPRVVITSAAARAICFCLCPPPHSALERRALSCYTLRAMTELIWDGKYKDGKKQGPVRIALPFQTVETVNESAQDRRRNLELFASGRDTEWRNRLIWGDKKYVLPSLLPEFAGRVDLIYIDPPFDTGANFSFPATIPDHSQD